MNIDFKKLTYTLGFSFIGVLLPYISGYFQMEHILLTMQIPILLCAYLLPIKWAVTCAVLTPVLNTIFLGDPALFPLFPIALCQLITLAASFHMLAVALNKNLYLSLFISIVAGWLIFFCAASIMSWVLDGIDAIRYTLTMVKHGLLGIGLQVIIVPPILRLIHVIREKDRESDGLR